MRSSIKHNMIFKFGCLSMLSMIALGGRYGHEGEIDQHGVVYFRKAQIYHLANNLGLFASCLVPSSSIPLKLAVTGFSISLLIFVAPLYYISLKEKNQYTTKIMPIGGVCMLASWPALMIA